MNRINAPFPERHLIDPVMFFVALILAPVLVTLATFWIFLVPVGALVLGGPFYLIFATPILLLWLSWHAPKPREIAWIGFCANLAVSAGMYLYAIAVRAYDPENMAMMYLYFGSVFAPLWAWAFAKLYLRLRRPFFAQTI